MGRESCYFHKEGLLIVKELSIITVCLNAEKYIGQTIKSVVQQKCKEIEYIIIDGGSIDRTVHIIRSYKDSIDKVVSEPDLGIYDAMNKGIRLSNSKFILLLNADDYLENGIICQLLSFIKNNNADIFHGSMNVVDEFGRKKRVVHPPKRFFARLRATPFKHPTCVVSKLWYSKVGMYDIEYETAADYDFMLRSISQNAKICQYSFVLTNLRTVGVSSGTPGVTNPNEVMKCLYRHTKSKFVSVLFVFLRVLIKLFKALSLKKHEKNC